MIISYLSILLLLGLAIAFPFVLLMATSILGPRVQTRVKAEAYECGVPAVGSTQEGVSVKFYRIAILFLLFDVEAALLFPWAVIFRNKLGDWGVLFLVGELLLFLLVLLAGYIYAWHRGGLEWE